MCGPLVLVGREPDFTSGKDESDLIQQHLQLGGEEQDCLALPSVASVGRSGPDRKRNSKDLHRDRHRFGDPTQ